MSAKAKLSCSEDLIAFGIALASILMAVVVWRATVVGSNASDANRLGLINTVKQEAATSENWRMVYQEASFAQIYAVYKAEADALSQSSDPLAATQLSKIQEIVLPGIADISPLATDKAYQKPDGTMDLQARFQDYQAKNPDLRDLKPLKSYQAANRLFIEQRWLSVVAILFVVTIFWFTLAQISGARMRWLLLAIAGASFTLSVFAFAGIEAFFLMS